MTKKPLKKNAIPAPVAANSKFRINMKLSLLLAFFSLLVYANTLKNGFVLDDHIVIKDNHFVTKGLIPEILTTPYHRGWSPIGRDDLYRPLSLVMFSMEYQLFGDNATPYHLLNILVFSCCVVLLFLFLDQLFQQKRTIAAFIAALLFALHPIHTEVVANIKSRDELLCFCFAFLCLNILIKYLETGKITQIVAGAFCFLLALLSKESVITFAAIVPVCFFLYRNEQKKRSVYICAGIALAICVYFAIRLSVFGHYPVDNSIQLNLIENAFVNKSISVESKVATAVFILGYYLRLLLVPYPLISDYSFNSIPFVHFSHPLVLVSLAIYLFLIFFSIWKLTKNNKDPYAFGILFFLITLSLFTNIFFLLGTTMAERLLFFPSVGFCFCATLLIERFIVKMELNTWDTLTNPRTLRIFVPIALIYSFIAIGRNTDWSDNYTLYKADVAKAPNDARLNQYVADEMLTNVLDKEPNPARQQQLKIEAADYLKKALTIYPDYVNAHADLGLAYTLLSMYDSAETHFKRSISLEPKASVAISNLARLYFNQNKFEQSIEYNKKMVALNPGYVVTYANIGLAFTNLKKYDSSFFYLNEAIRIDPHYIGTYEILAMTYKAAGNMDSAKKYENLSREKDPGFKL